MSENKKHYDEEVQRLLKTIISQYELEDWPVRQRQVRQWRQLKFMWSGFTQVWYSEVAHDWRIFGDANDSQGNNSQYYDKQVNVFRAYLESIIAALSVSVPALKCYPDDADNPLDIATAKAGDRISELIYRHNDAVLLWLHALFIYCTEGMIACHSYSKEDESYGTYSKPKTEQTEEDQQQAVCPLCQQQLADEALSEREQNEFFPDDDDVAAHDLLNEGKVICPNCLAAIDPEYRTTKIVVERIVGTTSHPKSRQCIEVFGGLFVKVPNYARNQCEAPYLIYAHEVDYACAIEQYPHLNEKLNGGIKPNASGGGMGMYDAYEKYARLSPQYINQYPTNLVTIRECWLRPSTFNRLPEEDCKRLKKLFPDGVKVCLVNDQYAEACNANLDDEWTLSHNPLSDYVHYDPLGSLLTSIQEITTDLVSLVLQTIEHGIPQTFADPGVLNFEQYRQTEVQPGAIYPAKPASGKGLNDAFYEVKTATLSGEVLPFMEKVQEAGQLVSGALPSLFGGTAQGQGKTAAQYAMSRAQALQRLQTPWKMLTIWWQKVFSKVIPAYIKDVIDQDDDERFVMRDKSEAGFVNVFIKRADLEGKIGSVELESSEQLPITWSQKKDVIMMLLQAGNPLVMQAISDPQNLPLIADALGMSDFVLPGEDDREKQYEEIKILINSQPTQEIDPQATEQAMMSGQPMQQPVMKEVPTVQVDPMVDNHQVEADICRGWLISSAGRLCKIENPEGYKNVLLHMQQHVNMHQALTAMNTPPPMQQQEQPKQAEQPQPGVANVPRNIASTVQ